MYLQCSAFLLLELKISLGIFPKSCLQMWLLCRARSLCGGSRPLWLLLCLLFYSVYVQNSSLASVLDGVFSQFSWLFQILKLWPSICIFAQMCEALSKSGATYFTSSMGCHSYHRLWEWKPQKVCSVLPARENCSQWLWVGYFLEIWSASCKVERLKHECIFIYSVH